MIRLELNKKYYVLSLTRDNEYIAVGGDNETLVIFDIDRFVNLSISDPLVRSTYVY